MRYGELLRRARRRVQEIDVVLGIPRPLDVDLLLDRLERHRSRRIDLHPTSETIGGPCGLWIQQRDRDVIVYAADTSELHQDHIILHEIGHMIAYHSGDCVLPFGAAHELVPSVMPALIQHIFARSSYSTGEELEAEMIASYIWFAASEGRSTEPASHQLTWIEQTFGM